MMIRTLLFASVVALAACNPQTAPENAPVAAETDPNSPDNELPVAAELLAGEPLAGAWQSVGDGATVGVLFTSPAYADTLAIGCNTGDGRAFINWTVQNPAEDGEVRVYTVAKTETFAAMGSNAGSAIRTIDVAGSDPRLAALKATQTKFGVQGSGEAIVVPWDPQIAAVLNDCGA